MIPVLFTPPDTLTVITGNPTMTSLDGLYVAPLATVIAPSFSDEERAGFGVYLAVEFDIPNGYHTVGLPSYAFPDILGFPYYVQQTFEIEENPPEPPSVEDRVTALESDWATGGTMRVAIEAAIVAIPTKASNAPAAVASSSALGAVETRYAREDHEHAINASQQGQISALQGNVSSLLTLTGGLNTPAPATATPAAPAASGAVGTASKYAREDHVHPLPAAAASTPSRTLNSAGFQPSTTKLVLVSYSVRITCTASLSGGQDGKIELMSDANATPTTVRAVAQNRNSVSLAIALTAINEQTAQLSALVPAGHYVRLISTQTTGAPTFAIVSQSEVVVG